MNDDELKKLWQEQPLREPAPAAAQLVSDMQNKTSQLRSTLLSRDIVELVAPPDAAGRRPGAQEAVAQRSALGFAVVLCLSGFGAPASIRLARRERETG